MTNKTMRIEAIIKEKLEAALSPDLLEIINQSAHHQGHAGDDGSGESHFKLIVVSSLFHGCNRIQRHRLVYDALKGAFPGGLHALALTTLTPEEYARK